MSYSRRDFLLASSSALISTAALSVVRGTSAAECGSAGIRTRKDVATLSATSPDIVTLKKAVTKMRALPNADRRSWQKQAEIHGTVLGPFGNCKHGNWFFLPWHRGYLYFFEEIIRELGEDDSFALPYWDWSRAHQLPATFWGAGNPLANPARPGQSGSGRAVSANSQFTQDHLDRFVGSSAVAQILSIPTFEGFGGEATINPNDRLAQGGLEQTPHNFIHRWVGGDMASGGSPFDPIFWLHHCNVDRLWTEWVIKHPSGTPNTPSFLNRNFTDFVKRDGLTANIAVKDVLDTAALCYQYDTRRETVLASPTAVAPPVFELAASTFSFAEGAGSAQVNADTAQVRKLNDITQGAIGSLGEGLRLRVRGVQVPRNEDVELSVFVNCLKATSQTPITDPSYVGSCTFFGHASDEPQGHGHDGTASFTFNATPAFRRLYADRPLSPDEPLKVWLVTNPLFPDRENAPPASVKELNPKQVSFEVVKT